jgi:hypothetical protein
MKFLSALLLGLVACGPGSEVCPSGWFQSASAPGSCRASTTFVDDTTASISSGVYGFVRTDAHGGSKLVVGTLVFAVPAAAGTCDAPSVSAVGQATTDVNGVFVMSLPAGDYLVTSGEVPSCTPVHVDAGTVTEVALTYP